MKSSLSVIIIAKNSEDVIVGCLQSVKNIAQEIIVIDNGSTDNTVAIAKNFKAKIYVNLETDLGSLKNYALHKSNGDWILSLDSDEVVSKNLNDEIKHTLSHSSSYEAYIIPFQNHFLGKPLHYGGENYQMLRLFRKNAAVIKPALVHEGFVAKKGVVIGEFKFPINHYSYRSLSQMYKKFTDYALREARQKKLAGEKTSVKKICLYAPHMFWARFIKDQGYKDGLWRLPLDLGFAYMELLTYLKLLF